MAELQERKGPNQRLHTPPPTHTHVHTHTHVQTHTHNSPFSSPAAYKNSELLGVPRMFYVLQREKGVAQKWDRAW